MGRALTEGWMQPAPRQAPALGPVLEFMRELWALDHALQSLSKRMKAEHGITGPQRLAIRVIGKFPGASPGDLAEILCLHPSTLSGVLKRLQSAGTLQREPHPWDRRRAVLRLTARGKRLDRIDSGTVEAGVQRLLERTPRTRLNGACSLIRLLTAGLANELQAPVAKGARQPRPTPSSEAPRLGLARRHAGA